MALLEAALEDTLVSQFSQTLLIFWTDLRLPGGIGKAATYATWMMIVVVRSPQYRRRYCSTATLAVAMLLQE